MRVPRLRPFGSLGAVVAVALAVLLTADEGRAVYSISIDRLSLDGAFDFTLVPTWETTVRRVARVMRSDLDLPLPDRFTVRLYASSSLLEQGLVDDLGVEPALAARLGDFAAGVALDRHLLLLQPEWRRGARSWTRLVAHEMTHLSQRELAGDRGRASQWLAEGMADWVAYTVLDRLGISPMAGERALTLTAAREALDAGVPLDLSTLASPRGFLDATARDGVSTYRLAFLLTDRLIERHGFPRLVGYFRDSDPGDTAFARAFGESPSAFAREWVAPQRERGSAAP